MLLQASLSDGTTALLASSAAAPGSGALLAHPPGLKKLPGASLPPPGDDTPCAVAQGPLGLLQAIMSGRPITISQNKVAGQVSYSLDVGHACAFAGLMVRCGRCD